MRLRDDRGHGRGTSDALVASRTSGHPTPRGAGRNDCPGEERSGGPKVKVVVEDVVMAHGAPSVRGGGSTHVLAGKEGGEEVLDRRSSGVKRRESRGVPTGPSNHPVEEKALQVGGQVPVPQPQASREPWRGPEVVVLADTGPSPAGLLRRAASQVVSVATRGQDWTRQWWSGSGRLRDQVVSGRGGERGEA